MMADGRKMTDSVINRRTLLAGLGGALPWFTGCGAKNRNPNIVFFLADDLGTTDLGCYGS
jgi:hypothetical protein